MISMRCIVSGRVQGVWFRDSTRRQARALGLTGRAINLPDGTVEVVMSGEADAVEQLRSWLWRGPELADVEGVDCQPLPPQGFGAFTIG